MSRTAPQPVEQGDSSKPPKSTQLWRLLGLMVILGAAAVGGQRFVTRSPHFAVDAVRFSPTVHVSAESLSARMGAVMGANLFAVNLDEVSRAISEEPWIAKARARRELPSSIMVEVVERQAACVVALGPLYLADPQGAVFKRATPEEAVAFPVVTGIDRDHYLSEPERARSDVRDAMAVLAAWRIRGERPAIGEIHVDRLLGVTLYTVEGGVGIRVGEVNQTLTARLERFDTVWSALAASGERPRIIYLDNRARPDRVTVKLRS